jgi:hypothetical protein
MALFALLNCLFEILAFAFSEAVAWVSANSA